MRSITPFNIRRRVLEALRSYLFKLLIGDPPTEIDEAQVSDEDEGEESVSPPSISDEALRMIEFQPKVGDAGREDGKPQELEGSAAERARIARPW